VNRTHKIILAFNVIIVILTIFSYISPYIHPETTWFFAMFGLAYPWLFFANVFFLLIWAIISPWKMILSVICLLFGINNIDKFFASEGLHPNQDRTNIFNLATFNIQGSKSITWIKDEEEKNTELKNYKRFLNRAKPIEILCVQELSVFSSKWINEVFKYTNSHALENKSTGIFTSFPIVRKGEIDFNTEVNSCVWADIVANNDTIRVYNAHLQSNRISGKESELIENGKWEKETIGGIRQMFSKYQKYTITRSRQVALIKEHMEQCPYPYIIGGDFNDPPQSYVYQRMSKNLSDSFREAGSGFGTTYRGVIPALRIDYVLASEDFEFYSHKVRKTEYSDHYPVVTTLALP